jgi:hypothetical protein
MLVFVRCMITRVRQMLMWVCGAARVFNTRPDIQDQIFVLLVHRACTETCISPPVPQFRSLCCLSNCSLRKPCLLCHSLVVNNCPVLGVPVKSRDVLRICTLRFAYSVWNYRVLYVHSPVKIPSPKCLHTAVVAAMMIIWWLITEVDSFLRSWQSLI